MRGEARGMAAWLSSQCSVPSGPALRCCIAESVPLGETKNLSTQSRFSASWRDQTRVSSHPPYLPGAARRAFPERHPRSYCSGLPGQMVELDSRLRGKDAKASLIPFLRAARSGGTDGHGGFRHSAMADEIV